MTKVYSISEDTIALPSLKANSRRQSICPEIDAEYVNRALDSKLRQQLFDDILENNPNGLAVSEYLKYIVYGFSTIVAAFLSTCFQTLIPQHNVIENPDYWYELPLVGIPTCVGLVSAYFIYTCIS